MDELERLGALSPRVDEAAARSVFDRARRRCRRRRRLLAGGAAAVVAVAAVAGVVAAVDRGDSHDEAVVAGEGEPERTPVTRGDGRGEVSEACGDIRIDGPGIDVDVRHVTAPTFEGERSGPAGWERVAGSLDDGTPAVAMEVAWYGDGCWLEVAGPGATVADLEAFVEGSVLRGPDAMPVLDPRGAVWPETAQQQVPETLPDDRLSADATAIAFAREVLGWDDVIEEDLVAEPAHNGCDGTVYVRRASAPDREVGVNMALAVGRRWWSVCGAPGFDPGFRVEVTAATITVSLGAGALPAGATGASVVADYGGQRYEGIALGRPYPLVEPPATTGSVVLLFRDVDDEVIGFRAAQVPAGDVTIGEPPDAPEDLPIVVSQHGVLGWWDGASWRDVVDPSARLPYEPGDELTVVGLDQPPTTATAGEPRSQEFCNTTIELEPAPWPDDWSSVAAPIAVRAAWDVQPRPVMTLDPAAETYRQAVADELDRLGVAGQQPRTTQALRVDLDGDGTDEVLLVATHPDSGVGGSPRAGWYSVVLLRRIVDGDVETVVLRSTVFTEDDPENYPTMAIHELGAIGDLNGDGRMEAAVRTGWFEGAETTVYDLGPQPVVALSSGYCGV